MKKSSQILAKLEEWFIGIGLLMITLVLFINVVLRFGFGSSLGWAEEFVRYGIIWVTFIGASVCIYKGAHIGIDVVVGLFSERIKRGIIIVVNCITVLFATLFSILSFQLFISAYENNQVSVALGMPMTYVYAALLVGGILMAIRFVETLWQSAFRTEGDTGS